MRAFAFMLLIYDLIGFALGREPLSYWIESNPTTNSGDWSLRHECGKDSGIAGFIVYKSILNKDDQTSLAHISFTCFRDVVVNTTNEDGGKLSIKREHVDFSKEMAFKLRKELAFSTTDRLQETKRRGSESVGAKRCQGNGYAIGFELRVQKSHDGDNTATNNIRLICRENDIYTNKNGLQWSSVKVEDPVAGNSGKWTGEKWCLRGFVLCGWQIQKDYINKRKGIWRTEDSSDSFEKNSKTQDLTGLNNIRMKCCEKYDPLNCVVNVQWKTVLIADNRKGATSMTYKKKYSHRVLTSKVETHEDFTSQKDFEKIKVGASVEGGWPGIVQAKVSTEFEKQSTTYKEQRNKNSNKEEVENINEDTYETDVAPFTYSISEQGVGICGVVKVETKFFRKDEDQSVLLTVILVPLLISLAVIITLLVLCFCCWGRIRRLRGHLDNPPEAPSPARSAASAK